MANWRIIAVALGFAAGTVVAAQASGPAFNAKPGLWVMTVTGHSSGAPPIPAHVLAHMSRRQRAQLKAAMRSAIARRLAPRVIKNCITPDQLRRLPKFAEREGSVCTRTILRRTATEIEFHMQCQGEETMSGTVYYRAPNPKSITGNVDFTTSGEGHTMRIKEQISGKWSGSDCGSVKPLGK